MKIVLTPKTVRGLDVHVVNTLNININMYLLCKIWGVLVLGVVLESCCMRTLHPLFASVL
jgi:hypothetical protein